jgi:hypothetical protein
MLKLANMGTLTDENRWMYLIKKSNNWWWLNRPKHVRHDDFIFFYMHSGGWSPNWIHSARRPLTGLLYLPRVMVRTENLVEWMAGEKTCPGTTLSTTNPTWPDLGLNPGRRGGKPATNRFSYGAANDCIVSTLYLLWWRNERKKVHTHNMMLRYNICNYNTSEECYLVPDMALCSAVKMGRLFRRIYRLCLHGWRVSQASATDFQRTTWLCVLDVRTLHKYRCESHRSCKYLSVYGREFNQDNIVFYEDKDQIYKEFLGFWTLSIVRCLKEHDDSETGSVSILRSSSFNHRTMDKVQKPRNSLCYSPSSQPFRNDQIYSCVKLSTKSWRYMRDWKFRSTNS